MALDKLGSLFPIKTLLLEGGGHVNGSLLKAGLVDELSLSHYPVTDGAGTSLTVLEQGPQPGPAMPLQQRHVEQLANGVLWLRYDVTRP